MAPAAGIAEKILRGDAAVGPVREAVNSVPEFRIRIRGDEVVRLDGTEPGITDMKKGSG